MDYDVIVAGAGPAGSTAAARLSQLGRRVLLLDRAGFPRDKTCGDAIQAGAIGLLRELGYQTALDPALFHPVTDWMIEAPSRRSVSARLDTHGHDPYIARRIQFDQLVYEQAIANGTTFCKANVTAPLLDNGRVIGVLAKADGAREPTPFYAPITIAADGATSVIGRALHNIRQEDIHWAVAIRGYAELSESLQHRCEFYFPKSIMPGYAWIFPTGERTANIGVGLRLDKYRLQKTSLEDLLNRFLEMLGERVIGDSLTETKSWQLPFGSSRHSRVYDGCLLVGDAGGFIDPLLGAGIFNGMRTGDMAAQVAHRALSENDLSTRQLSEFDRLWKRQMGWALRRATWVQKIVVGHSWVMSAVFVPASWHPALGRLIVKTLSGEKI